MNLASPTVEVVEGIHQPVVFKFGVLQMGSEMSLAVGNQAGQTGFEGFAGVVHAGVTQHILWELCVRRLAGRIP